MFHDFAFGLHSKGLIKNLFLIMIALMLFSRGQGWPRENNISAKMFSKQLIIKTTERDIYEKRMFLI